MMLLAAGQLHLTLSQRDGINFIVMIRGSEERAFDEIETITCAVIQTIAQQSVKQSLLRQLLSSVERNARHYVCRRV